MLTQYIRGRIFNYDYCIGGAGVGGKGFFLPSDFALGSDRTLYVLNKSEEFVSAHGITKCNLDSDLIWENRGDDFARGRGPFPTAIAVDSGENIYVADEFKNQVYVFDVDGNPLGDWRPNEPGNDRASKRILTAQNTAGEGVAFDLYLKKVGTRDTSVEGELNGPMGLAFDNDDQLYVSDSYNHRVQVFTKNGTFLRKWGTYGAGEGDLNLPWGLTVDNEGYVYVADWKNSRVQKFSPDGDYLATFGGPGSGDGELHRPSSVAVDKDGDVYVADWGRDCLHIYESDGTHLVTFTGDAEQPSVWAQARLDADLDRQRARKRADLSREKYFYRPVSVRVDDEGRIMVLESRLNRIQIYVKEQDWVEPSFIL